MDFDALLASLRGWGQFDYTHSDGPGGQNVQKTATKVRLRIRWEDVGGLTEGERIRARTKLQKRLNKVGELAVSVQDERSQKINKDVALERMVNLITSAAKAPRARRSTRPSLASKERRLNFKHQRSGIKRQRSGAWLDE